jgi:[ribosomal protein S5]-alanine N-acetyltransferase
MLNGDRVVLRPVRERDLPAFIDAHTEIANRGEFFPLGVLSEPVLRRNYAETGLWERDEGTLLIWNRDDVMVGHIEFLRPVSYWDAYELSYQLYGQEHAGQGYTTEAVCRAAPSSTAAAASTCLSTRCSATTRGPGTRRASYLPLKMAVEKRC